MVQGGFYDVISPDVLTSFTEVVLPCPLSRKYLPDDSIRANGTFQKCTRPGGVYFLEVPFALMSSPGWWRNWKGF